jgi:DNA-binding IclR family transcriptional regulator
MKPAHNDNRKGIQSIEIGGSLLHALVRHGRPMKLTELAAAAQMPSAKAHGYLVSLQKIGLIEQDPVSGTYGLGGFALQLGLASLHQLDVLRLAEPLVEDLVARIGQTTAIVVWGNQGPTVVRLIEANVPLHVNLRVGTVMSLSATATGRVFAAYLPPKRVEQLLAESPAHALGDGPKPLAGRALEKALADIRATGLGRAVGAPIPGINALSAPVFDHTAQLALVLTALGPAGFFDVSPKGPIAVALLKAAATLSERLGYRPPR